jgi:O-acetyl-ADP-ribose deacetylase (regulator of RNase III)
MLEFVEGDMFEAPADIRVNTVNCVGAMGAGVALAFKQRYPEMFQEYQRACKEGLVRPGEMHVWHPLVGDWVINFPTKRHWRDPSRYEDIESGLEALRAYLEPLGSITIAMPALGCGNGGLDWERVSGVIRKKLDGVNAHIRIYAPAASRQAGRSALKEPTNDELKSVEQLGYARVPAAVANALGMSTALFAKSKPDTLTRRWIALLPSRTPDARELQALRSIATELVHRDANIAVALVHGSRSSEEIANIFASAGVSIILLLPFGVLTRKSLAKLAQSEHEPLINLVSIAPANAKWSRALFTQTMNLLRARAGSLLISDPEPEWLVGHGIAQWSDVPTAYVRYERAPEQIRHALSAAGATAIGRRGENGAPNLDRLLDKRHTDNLPIEQDHGWQVQANCPTSSSPPDLIADGEPSFSSVEPTVLTIDLSEYPDATRRRIVSMLLDAVPAQLMLKVGLSEQAAAKDLHRCIEVAVKSQIERKGSG